MPQNIQDLISKIKTEGIEEAQKKAKVIEEEAQKKAQEIVAKAKAEADSFFKESEIEINKKREAAEKALKQAARDTLLNLKQKIEQVLKRVVLEHVGHTLTTEQLSHVITRIVENSFDKNASPADIRVMLNGSDLEKLKKGFLARLQEQLKDGIHLQPSSEIAKGFTISFDGGKSAFDFTDESLAEFLCTYLNPEITTLLKDIKIDDK